MDTTSLTKRLKIEIDGWPSLGGLEASKEDIRNIKEILGPKVEIIKVFSLYNTSLIHNHLFLLTMLSTYETYDIKRVI